MDAPTYPPAVAFVQPIGAAQPLTVETFSVAELMQIPAAWEILSKHVPALKLIVSASQAKPHLGNMTLSSFSLYLPSLTPAAYAAINAELAQLPPSL